MNLDIAHVLIILMVVATFLLWRLPAPCVCEHCAYHKEERRRAEARQRELQHDQAHKGWGWQDDTPDWMECKDPACPRNPAKR